MEGGLCKPTIEIWQGGAFLPYPSTVAFGNERDMDKAKAVLRACKESILNAYSTRIRISRNDAADMMMKTSWMDANEAFEKGFVDGVTETPAKLPTDSAGNQVSLDMAKAGVQAWFERKTRPFSVQRTPQSAPQPACVELPDEAASAQDDRVHVIAIDTRLEHLRF